jgi:hypothetical protein
MRTHGRALIEFWGGVEWVALVGGKSGLITGQSGGFSARRESNERRGIVRYPVFASTTGVKVTAGRRLSQRSEWAWTRPRSSLSTQYTNATAVPNLKNDNRLSSSIDFIRLIVIYRKASRPDKSERRRMSRPDDSGR